MITRISEHPEAAEELYAAMDWYEDQKPGLGDEVLNAAELTIEAIIEYPEAWPIYLAWGGKTTSIRSHGLVKFPYRVVYFIEGETLNIVAYSHINREPDYWSHRL